MPFRKRLSPARGQGAAVRMAAVPMAYSVEERFKPSYRTILESGTEQLTPVNIASTDASNTVIQVYDLSPMNFASSRLRDLAVLYQNFRFKKLSFVYEPMVPTTTAGSLYFGYCVDVDDPISIGDTFLSGLSRLDHSRSSVFSPTKFTLGPRDFSKFVEWYWTFPKDDGSRVSSQGKFFIGYSGPVGSSIMLGNLQLDWEIELQRPSGPIAGVTTTTEPYRAPLTKDIVPVADYLKLATMLKETLAPPYTYGKSGNIKTFKMDGLEGFVNSLKANETKDFISGLKMISTLINVPVVGTISGKVGYPMASDDVVYILHVVFSSVGFVGPETADHGITYFTIPVGMPVEATTMTINGYPRVDLQFSTGLSMFSGVSSFATLVGQYSIWGNTKLHTAVYLSKKTSATTYYAHTLGVVTVSSWEETVEVVDLFNPPSDTTSVLCGATGSSPACIYPTGVVSASGCEKPLH